MPKMGESISEATIINWTKNVGDYIEAEGTLLEVATDKVDSEVPSSVSGTITEIRFQKDVVVEVGTVLALIDPNEKQETRSKSQEFTSAKFESQPAVTKQTNIDFKQVKTNPDAFLSPLIISIAQKENLSLEEVQSIPGSGNDGRIQKSDVFNYLKNRKYPLQSKPITDSRQPTTFPKPKINFVEGKDRIVEMDRMRKMIADHMVKSKATSPHVTSFTEADVTNIVNWRNKIKTPFEKKFGEKITFTPIFIEAIVNSIKKFPMINSSLEGNNIIVKKDINIGMAAALPTGNLIVPVIKNADTKNLYGLTKEVNLFTVL